MEVRDWKRMVGAADELLEVVGPTAHSLKFTQSEIAAFDNNGKRLGLIVWGPGTRNDIGHGEKWNTQLRCDQTFHVNLGSI
jgi:hypothetical protein